MVKPAVLVVRVMNILPGVRHRRKRLTDDGKVINVRDFYRFRHATVRGWPNPATTGLVNPDNFGNFCGIIMTTGVNIGFFDRYPYKDTATAKFGKIPMGNIIPNLNYIIGCPLRENVPNSHLGRDFGKLTVINYTLCNVIMLNRMNHVILVIVGL